MNRRTVETKKGITSKVLEGGQGEPLFYLHGAGGLLPQEPLLEALSERYHIYAPEWPGYGEEPTEDLVEDMLDFTLHGWDLAEALGLERPRILGHSMGGMIAAEMAALNPRGVEKLALIAPAGLWLDAHPIPDIFAMMPFELPNYLFADPAKGTAMLTGGRNFSDNDALRAFLVGNARRLGTAGKILFPVPNRRLSKRLYRLSAPALLVWGEQDKLIPPVYAEEWQRLVPQAGLVMVDDAGHMAPYEQPETVAKAVREFLG